MRECICGNCVHLLEVIEDNGPTGEYACIHGYPGEPCETCETGECELSCAYWQDADHEIESVRVTCEDCGREMLEDAGSSEDGACYCVSCYLKRC